MHTLYHPALNGRKASDWLRPIPCQWEGNKLPPKGAYQSGDGYSTRVHLSEHLACVPLSRIEASHISSQGKEAVSVTHDIYTHSFCNIIKQYIKWNVRNNVIYIFKHKFSRSYQCVHIV